MNLKPFIEGNILLLVCCGFYLAWWLVAFHPQHGVRGIKTGWLLLPAAAAGVMAVVTIVQGIFNSGVVQTPIPLSTICVTGIIIYLALLVGTWIIMKRPVTTELFLIVGWMTLVVSEINILYAGACFGGGQAIGLVIATIMMAVISMVCYLAYYHLDAVKGYYDGAVPLVLVAVMTIIMLVFMDR